MENRKTPARLRRISVIALSVAGLVGTGVTVATPASADPATTYVAVGSDVTQDVLNQFASDEFPGQLGSWNAINPTTGAAHEVITPKPGCSITRPNGSTEGLNALRASIDPSTAAAQLAQAPSAGCVDIARSSSGPGGAAATDGALQYIPFALDAVATATGPTTAVTGTDPAAATAITHADDFTLGTQGTPGDLVSLYRDCKPVLVDGVTYDPNIPAAAGAQQIHLYVPQSGSGTRTFWASTLGFNSTTLPSCVHDTIVGTSTPVQQDDGTVFAQDPDALGPFSVAQFISQSDGHDDRRHDVALHELDPSATGGTKIAPITDGTLDTAYPITREVYNIVARSRVVAAGSTNFDPTLAALLVGPNSQLCADELTILDFGFATLDNAPLGHTCGATTNDLRAFDPNSNPV